MKTIIEQFNEIDKIKVFEFEVIDKRTNETEYLIFDIETNNNNEEPLFIVSHEALNQEEEQSNKIPRFVLNIDNEVSLDKHLQQLYEDSTNEILWSDWYELI